MVLRSRGSVRAQLLTEYIKLKNIEELYPPKVEESLETLIVNATEEETEKAERNFGVTILLANIFVFLFSLVFCTIAKVFVTLTRKFFSNLKKPETNPMPAKTLDEILLEREKLQIERAKDAVRSKNNPSGEPGTDSLANIEVKSTQTQMAETYTPPPHQRIEQTLRGECAKLRDELVVLQSTSLREHALLSRKLESMAKEKRELSKRLSVVQKENQVARQQLDELVNEKRNIQKRLDIANKEFRFNTKTKKVALAKLEEVSSTVDDLRKQLEQTSRDKEILEGKLEVLRNEYEQLQARLRYYHSKSKMQVESDRRESAEKDDTTKDLSTSEGKCSESESLELSGSRCSLRCPNVRHVDKLKESIFLPYVISQTEVDMKNIQMRIMQLERNLKNFNVNKSDLKDDQNKEIKAENEFSNIPDSLGFSQSREDESSSNTTSILDDAPKKNFDELQLQMLTSALKDKVRMLETLKEREEAATADRPGSSATSTVISQEDEDEISSTEEFSSERQRIVSNSIAFQQFLQSIGGGAHKSGGDANPAKCSIMD